MKKRNKQESGPSLPPTIQLAKNFVKAVGKHVLDGFKDVAPEQYQARLDVCNKCSLRVGIRCTHIQCGCFIDKKAWWASEDCPIKKWPSLDDENK